MNAPDNAASGNHDLIAYQKQHLPGGSKIQTVIFSQRARVTNSSSSIDDLDLFDVDQMAINYLKTRLPSDINLKISEGPADTARMQSSKGQIFREELVPGTLYVTIEPFPQKTLEMFGTRESLALFVQGNANDIGKPEVFLREAAPGDVDCGANCDTTREAFGAIEGRLKAVILRVKG